MNGQAQDLGGSIFDRVAARSSRVRDRREASTTLRKPDLLPPTEVRFAIQCLVERNVGMDRDELAQRVARTFGFGATSAQMVRVVETELERLVGDSVAERNGKLFGTSVATA